MRILNLAEGTKETSQNTRSTRKRRTRNRYTIWDTRYTSHHCWSSVREHTRTSGYAAAGFGRGFPAPASIPACATRTHANRCWYTPVSPCFGCASDYRAVYAVCATHADTNACANTRCRRSCECHERT